MQAWATAVPMPLASGVRLPAIYICKWQTHSHQEMKRDGIPTLSFNSVLSLRAAFRRVVAADVEESEQQVMFLMQLGWQFYLDLQRQKSKLPTPYDSQRSPGKQVHAAQRAWMSVLQTLPRTQCRHTQAVTDAQERRIRTHGQETGEGWMWFSGIFKSENRHHGAHNTAVGMKTWAEHFFICSSFNWATVDLRHQGFQLSGSRMETWVYFWPGEVNPAPHMCWAHTFPPCHMVGIMILRRIWGFLFV